LVIDMTKLDDKARELGFAIKRGPTRFGGYTLKRLNVAKQAAAKNNRARKETVDHLIDDDELHIDEYDLQLDEYPIGSDYKWGLAYIEDWLDAHAADIAAGRVKASDDDDAEPEVETSVKLAKVKPPAAATINKALRGHEHASEIRAMAKSAKVSDPTGPTLQDLMFEERARESRKRHAIEEKWKTNLDSIRDPWHEQDYDEAFNLYRDGERDRRNWLHSIEKENAAFLRPEAGGYDTPKPATGFQVVSKRRRGLSA
jgi:hypothetical protein